VLITVMFTSATKLAGSPVGLPESVTFTVTLNHAPGWFL
jgi:hypothetical protein